MPELHWTYMLREIASPLKERDLQVHNDPCRISAIVMVTPSYPIIVCIRKTTLLSMCTFLVALKSSVNKEFSWNFLVEKIYEVGNGRNNFSQFCSSSSMQRKMT